MHKFRKWIYETIRERQTVRSVCPGVADGLRGVSYENPAANYWRASRDPQDATETTAQLCSSAFASSVPSATTIRSNGGLRTTTTASRRPSPASAARTRSTDEEEVIFNAIPAVRSLSRAPASTMKVHLLLKGDVDVPAEGQDRREGVRPVAHRSRTIRSSPSRLVNRIWGHCSAAVIVEPVDDFRDSNPPSNAPLLDELAKQFVRQQVQPRSGSSARS